MSVISIGVRLPDLAEETLRFYRQTGVEVVEMPAHFSDRPSHRSPAPLLPPAQTAPPSQPVAAWDPVELLSIRERIEAFDLRPVMINLPLPRSILLGLAARDADIDAVCTLIAAAGRAGLPTIRYAFRALRPSGGYYLRQGGGRGGADLRAYDFERIRNDPPVEGIGMQSKAAMWERLHYFLKRAVPAAETAGVRLALHPNDPPPAEYRGIAQPVCTVADMQRVIEAIDSPANTIVGHPGVFTEMGADAPATLRYFGERNRIGAVHFRNVRLEAPYERYVETFMDDGDADMAACMRALHETGFDGMLDPDHVPGIAGDSEDQRISWALAIGAVTALRDAVAARPAPARGQTR
jgi:mannonate dehydratase